MRLFIVFILLFVPITSYAVDVSVDTAQDGKAGKDKSVSARASSESRESKTKRKSYSKSTGGESSVSSSGKFAAAMDRQSSLDLQLPIGALFLQEQKLWKSPADFGLGGDLGNGVVFATAQKYQAGLAKANGKITDAKVDEAQFKAYLLDLARQGTLIAQAAIYLQEDIVAVGRLSRKPAGVVEVRGLGSDDLKVLAKGALQKATGMISDGRLKNTLARIEKDVAESTCRFSGDVTTIKCGSAVLNVTTPPVVRYNGIAWFSATEGFGGLHGTYRVASNWSYSQALEGMKSDSAFSRWAAEVSAAAENLEAKGQSRDAVVTKRKAVEKAASSKVGLSVARFLPNHQQ
jgi:hypothetical protein